MRRALLISWLLFYHSSFLGPHYVKSKCVVYGHLVMSKPAYAKGKRLDVILAHDAVNDNVANVFRDFVAQRLILWDW